MNKLIFSILSCIVAYGSVNAMERYPLHEAAKDGNLQTVRHLLDEGYNVNLQDGYGNTPLLWVVSADNLDNKLEMMQFLLEHDAQANLQNNNGSAPLHWAISNTTIDSTPEIIQLLIKHGADVSKPDFYGRTPLHEAISRGKQKTVQLLLDKGANVNIPDNQGKTPLHNALTAGINNDIIPLILERNPSIDKQEMPISLYWGVKLNQPAIVRYLLKNGADVNMPLKNGWTALHWAVKFSDSAMIRLLLMHGADANRPDRFGKTALNMATLQNNQKNIQLLTELPRAREAIHILARGSSESLGKYSPVQLCDTLIFKNIFDYLTDEHN